MRERLTVAVNVGSDGDINRARVSTFCVVDCDVPSHAAVSAPLNCHIAIPRHSERGGGKGAFILLGEC